MKAIIQEHNWDTIIEERIWWRERGKCCSCIGRLLLKLLLYWKYIMKIYRIPKNYISWLFWNIWKKCWYFRRNKTVFTYTNEVSKPSPCAKINCIRHMKRSIWKRTCTFPNVKFRSEADEQQRWLRWWATHAWSYNVNCSATSLNTYHQPLSSLPLSHS